LVPKVDSLGECVQPPDHQLRQGGLETKDDGPQFRGRPIPQERSHLMNKMKTCLYKYNTRCDPFRKTRETYLEKGWRIKGGVEHRDEDTCKPFEDPKGGDEDATV